MENLAPIDYFKQAKTYLDANGWTVPILVFLLLMVLGSLPGIINTNLHLFNLLILGPVTLGLSMYVLDIVRGKKPGIERAFDGFKQYSSATIAYICTTILIILGLLCLIVPGIILAFGLSQVYFILADNPQMEGLDAIKESWRRMSGFKADYGVLFIITIGLLILGLLFFIVGIFVVLPITYVASAVFYEKNIKNQNITNV
jgi:uncharacterized membrane protein